MSLCFLQLIDIIFKSGHQMIMNLFHIYVACALTQYDLLIVYVILCRLVVLSKQLELTVYLFERTQILGNCGIETLL